MRECSHIGQCSFTPKGSMCERTARALFDTLTAADIKSLAGLDDVKVQKGRDNFKLLRDVASEVFDEGEERQKFIERIDAAKLYYQTEYIPHLQRVGSHCCNCMTCGFHNDENPNDIICEEKNIHKPSCTKCADSFSIIHELRSKTQCLLDKTISSYSKKK